MATTLTPTHPLLTVPFSVTTDFTLLADHCEQFVETLMESDDPTLKMALCGRLTACLSRWPRRGELRRSESSNLFDGESGTPESKNPAIGWVL
ncbi:hypothetical protein [Siccibacter turicensis]|uniref:hypothetical protein n=1 Tax=Siccibacter turicensis TaxID=357233 RepID=UPI002A6B03CE|nr:hypothetical protein [Siccibacter turicensis]MDY0969599.1 hypothetical protein [Siccibacter turicensis]